MKTTLVVLLALSLALAGPAYASGSITVHFQETLGYHLLPAAKACDVSVPAGSDVIAVLDQAVAQGCISSYHVEHYDFGDFVDCVDGVCGEPGTFWAFYVNEQISDYGASAYHPAPGDTIEFVYADWFTPFLGLP